jgi:Dyp-type peroxidase family
VAELSLYDIQGNILRGYNFNAGAHLFVELARDPEEGRRLVRCLLPEVTTARKWTKPPVVALNMALTYSGLEWLGVDESVLGLLPNAFREPIRHRARVQLGDDPDDWEPEFGNPATHMVVFLASSECRGDGDSFAARFPKLGRACDWLQDRIGDHGASCLYRQCVEALPGGQREHFGFRDGFGQPAVEGVLDGYPGQGAPDPDTGAWRDIKAGEFILGHLNEDGDSTPGDAEWLLYDGSFIVYRKLEQEVTEFRRLVAQQAARYVQARFEPEDRPDRIAAFELLAAKIVGRWRDGTAIELDPGPRRVATQLVSDWHNEAALELHPGPRREPTLDTKVDHHLDNNFRYGDDPNGGICPLGAHIRRANPRDQLGKNEQESARHRIIRRGMPYGPPYDSASEEDREGVRPDGDQERGLVFICFNADFERQFEVVQGQWCNDGNAFGIGDEQDYVLGSRDHGKLTIDGDPPFFATRTERLVRTRGCEYLFMPGLRALERLSAPASPVSDLEHIPPEEPAAIGTVVRLVCEDMDTHFAVSRPVLRGQHAKTHAVVSAKFIVEDVPDDLRAGLFERDCCYKAWIRFSASHPTLRSDAKPDAQGIAIKVMGVGGEKILPKERWLTTQDFILVNHDVFFMRDVMEVAGFARAITATGSSGHGVSLRTAPRLLKFFARRDRRGAVTFYEMLKTRPDNPLGIKYWSETPYGLGDRAVKYLVRPTHDVSGMGAEKSDWDSLEDVMQAALKQAGVEYTFDFLVQIQRKPTTMPVEDPMVLWSDQESPFIKVATIRIESQDFVLQERRNFGENLIFTPWHGLWAHRPLGGINRVRRAVYEASSELRHGLNGAPHNEPGGEVTPHPPRMPQ